LLDYKRGQSIKQTFNQMVNLGGMILQWNNKLQEKKETTKCMVEIIVSLLFKYIS
jgi:hypothetical protein